MIELDENYLDNFATAGEYVHESMREPLQDAYYHRDYIFEQYADSLLDYDEREAALRENEQEFVAILKGRCRTIITEVYETAVPADRRRNTDIAEWFAANPNFAKAVWMQLSEEARQPGTGPAAAIFEESLAEMA